MAHGAKGGQPFDHLDKLGIFNRLRVKNDRGE